LRPATRRPLGEAARKRGQGALRTGALGTGCPKDNHPPATPGRALGLTWRYGTPTATTLCAHGLKGKSGGAVGDRPADHDLGGVAIVFACFIVVVVSQFEDDLSLLAM